MVATELVRPRGGTAVLLDWDEVADICMRRLRGERADPAHLARAAETYNRYARELRPPLLETLGGLPPGTDLPDFQALDRFRWLEVNIGILRRAMEPLEEFARVPNSWFAQAGRAGLVRYVAALLHVLSGRVLGQFDPQLLGREPIPTQALYLVEPNVAAWERQAGLPAGDLRRWLILHEMTHAWQFAAHPWLREHLEGELSRLIANIGTGGTSGSPIGRVRALTLGAPAQWQVVRRMQATMSLVEGHGNLVMNLVGRRLLPSFDRLEAAHRARSGERSILDRIVWRLTGLEMKMEQYRVGERFAQAVHDRYGMDVLNLAWQDPDSLPRAEELRDPDRWYRRMKSRQGGTPR